MLIHIDTTQYKIIIVHPYKLPIIAIKTVNVNKNNKVTK